MYKLLLCIQSSLIMVLGCFAQQAPIDSKPQTDQAKIDRYKKKARAFAGTTFYPNHLSPAHNRIMPSAGIQFNIR
jgi:hypothetical protein